METRVNLSNLGYDFVGDFVRDTVCFRSEQSMKSEDPNTAKVVMVPVSKEDFRKVNDLAEASWIARDPNNVETIKELRRNLLKEVRHV